LGYYSSKFRYVHIFWNSQYVGMNQFVEKPGSKNLAEYFGTQRENFEAIAAGTPTNEIGMTPWLGGATFHSSPCCSSSSSRKSL
jgi:hypothetical protein